MKAIIRSITLWLAKSDRMWAIIERCFGRVIDLGRSSRELRSVISTDFHVRSGPFRGMLYPTLSSHGSAIAPKLLGTYESELHPTISELRSRGYNDIVDVGCAEGYYAVGLALYFPMAHVWAFDIASEARELCRALASANEVLGRVTIAGACTPEVLLSLPLRGRSLIVADCEGYEHELFQERVVAVLRSHDVLIELHDAFVPGVSSKLESLFKNTHDVVLLSSVDDLEKVLKYQVPELESAPLDKRFRLLAEKRGSVMQWLVARSRVDLPPNSATVQMWS